MPKRMNVYIQLPNYEHLWKPKGFLEPMREASALFHYAVSLQQTLKVERANDIRYEDGTDNEGNYFQLLKSIAQIYEVDAHVMVAMWESVDEQFDAMGMVRIPREDKYRQNSIPEIYS